MSGPREPSRTDLAWLSHLSNVRLFYIAFAGLYGIFAVLLVLPFAFRLAGVERARDPIGACLGCGGSLLGALVAMLGVVAAILLLRASLFLEERTHYAECVAAALVLLPFFPLGTIGGVWSLVVLRRPAVRSAFEPRRERRAGDSGSADGDTM